MQISTVTMSQSTGQTHGKADIGIALWAIKAERWLRVSRTNMYIQMYIITCYMYGS